MAIDFFEKEVKRSQTRFNETFGIMTVCNVETRQRAILAIIFLNRLKDKIKTADGHDKAREEIKKFVRTRDILNRIFNQIETHLSEERKRHAKKTTLRLIKTQKSH